MFFMMCGLRVCGVLGGGERKEGGACAWLMGVWFGGVWFCFLGEGGKEGRERREEGGDVGVRGLGCVAWVWFGGVWCGA